MGPQYANRISDLLEDVINGNQVVATEATRISEDSSMPRRGSDICAWVNIIYGCNERCVSLWERVEEGSSVQGQWVMLA